VTSVHWPNDGRTGPQAFRDYYAGIRSAVPDARYEVDDLIAEGDKVVVRWRLLGTHMGDFGGIAPTGRPIVLKGIAIYRVDHGKVMERWGRLRSAWRARGNRSFCTGSVNQEPRCLQIRAGDVKPMMKQTDSTSAETSTVSVPPVAPTRAMFVDDVDRRVAQTIVDHLETSTAKMGRTGDPSAWRGNGPHERRRYCVRPPPQPEHPARRTGIAPPAKPRHNAA